MQHSKRRREINTKLLFENVKGKRPLGRLRRKREGNIKEDIKEIGCEGVHWIRLVQDSQVTEFYEQCNEH
jgi:hypothetical protein